MAASNNATITLAGGATQIAAGGGANQPSSSWSLGSSLFAVPTLSLTTGTGDGQANNEYVAQRTLTAGSSDDLDLSGSLTNAFGASIATKIKALLVSIVSPAGVKKLQVGPGASSNPVVSFLPVATSYIEFFDFLLVGNVWGGWTVTAATGDILRIKNSSAVTLSYNIWIPTLG